MIATNHAVTGAVIAYATASVGLVWIALPVAFLSHFILDAIPHYDDKNGLTDHERIVGSKFNRLLGLDIAGCLAFVLILALLQPQYWLLLSIAAFVSTSPDLMWLPKYLQAQQVAHVRANIHWYERFHSWVQWRTGNDGKYIELAWFILMGLLLVFILT